MTREEMLESIWPAAAALRADPAFAEKPFDGTADLLYDLSRTSNVEHRSCEGALGWSQPASRQALGWKCYCAAHSPSRNSYKTVLHDLILLAQSRLPFVPAAICSALDGFAA